MIISRAPVFEPTAMSRNPSLSRTTKTINKFDQNWLGMKSNQPGEKRPSLVSWAMSWEKSTSPKRSALRALPGNDISREFRVPGDSVLGVGNGRGALFTESLCNAVPAGTEVTNSCWGCEFPCRIDGVPWKALQPAEE